jgi:hypothetical protein
VSPLEPVSPESTNGGSEDAVSPLSPNPNSNTPVKLQNDQHLIYGFF